MIEPITEATAMAHLRLAVDDPGLGRLPEAITAARQTVEQHLNATVANRSLMLTLDAFPAGAIRLPNGPVTAVTEIAYIDTDGAAQTVAAHRLINYPLCDVLTPAFGESWPATRNVYGAVTITYTAGMMVGETLANQDIAAAILLTLGDLWENREAQFVGVSVAINRAVDSLLHPHRREVGV